MNKSHSAADCRVFLLNVFFLMANLPLFSEPLSARSIDFPPATPGQKFPSQVRAPVSREVDKESKFEATRGSVEKKENGKKWGTEGGYKRYVECVSCFRERKIPRGEGVRPSHNSTMRITAFWDSLWLSTHDSGNDVYSKWRWRVDKLQRYAWFGEFFMTINIEACSTLA